MQAGHFMYCWYQSWIIKESDHGMMGMMIMSLMRIPQGLHKELPQGRAIPAGEDTS